MALLLLDYLGTFAFALSGALKAMRRKMDVFGVLVLALVTAVGGGTVRDVLLERIPPFWLTDRAYLLLVVAATLAALGLPRLVVRGEGLLMFFDAIGLGVFTVIGASKALSAGLGGIGAVTLGCLTGVGGGMLRDLLAAEVPLVLRREIYASASIAGALVLWLLQSTGVRGAIALPAGAACVIVLRLLAMHYGLGLPVFREPKGERDDDA